MFRVEIFCEATGTTAYFSFGELALRYQAQPVSSGEQTPLFVPLLTMAHGCQGATPEQARAALVAQQSREECGCKCNCDDYDDCDA